ncbi:MAG: hypothetical protein OXF26_06350 [Alphaproteobacteria bacterium]|nr:hypothetical protein [Alphaproteobacteria bacterium]
MQSVTGRDTLRRDRTILWQDVTGIAERPPFGSSWLNRVEAAQVIEWLGKVLESKSTVGVITPFAAQAQLVRNSPRIDSVAPLWMTPASCAEPRIAFRETSVMRSWFLPCCLPACPGTGHAGSRKSETS